MAKEKITIAGRAFDVPNPFAEGHVLTGAQADALNQVYHENIRNNLAKKLEGQSDDEAQATVDSYSQSYEFGVRTGGGGGSRDPVQTEAMRIAREAVKRGLQRKGHKISGDGAVPAKQITELAEKALDKNPQWKDQAREIVARNQQIAKEYMDSEGTPAAA
jgi:hypothetical protein